MNVIAPRTLRAFWESHPQAKKPLQSWLRVMQVKSYSDFNALREDFPSADYFSSPDGEFTVFNIGGNDFRLVTFVRYSAQTVFVKYVLTHAQYDTWNSRRNR